MVDSQALISGNEETMNSIWNWAYWWIKIPMSPTTGFPGGASGKEPCTLVQKTRDAGSIPGSGRALEGMAIHSIILAWRIPWTEGPGGLQSIGLQRVGHGWSDLACTHTSVVLGKRIYRSLLSDMARGSSCTFGLMGLPVKSHNSAVPLRALCSQQSWASATYPKFQKLLLGRPWLC